MNDTIGYMDAYFNGELDNDERNQFDAKCSTDESFAAEVAFYISARSAAREALLKQKNEQWKKDGEGTEMSVVMPANKRMGLRWLPYAAAACLVLVMAGYFLFGRQTPERIAATYATANYAQLSQSMDGNTKDSLQLGIAQYNNKNYNAALSLFEWARTNDSSNYDAKKYAGLAYLQLKDYNKAMLRFRDLSAMKSAYNAGDMLQAITLLQRQAPGDKQTAKALLEKVVREKEEGSTVAAKALANW